MEAEGPFFFVEKMLEWPDNVSRQTNDYCGTNQFSLDQALYSIRSGHINDCVIESNLLAANQRLEEDDELINLALAYLYFSRIDKKTFDLVVRLIQNKSPDRMEVRILTMVSWLWAKMLLPCIVLQHLYGLDLNLFCCFAYVELLYV